LINVLNNERYKVITKETEAILKGEYGKTPADVDKKLQDKVLGDSKPITCRPADLIDKNEYEQTKKRFTDLTQQKNIEDTEENILIYTLFPEIGLKFLENKDDKNAFEKSPIQLNEEKNGYYKVVIDDMDYIVKYSQTEKPEIINGNTETNAQPSNSNSVSNETGLIVKAPLAGNIFKIEKNIGDDIQEDETIIVLEAMKMETTIKTPKSGQIKNIFIKNGDKVQSGDPLFEVV
jgi:oxaloacetate decarboxylase alpha subunit